MMMTFLSLGRGLLFSGYQLWLAAGYVAGYIIASKDNLDTLCANPPLIIYR